MGAINLSNSKARNAQVVTTSVTIPLRVRYLDEQGRQVITKRVLKATLDRDVESLLKQAGGPEQLAEEMITDDPEIDLEHFGMFLRDTSRVYVNPERAILHQIAQWEVVHAPDGTVKDRRPRKAAIPNVATETPLKWSGRLVKKSEVYRKVVFASKMQIVHDAGLTYDFLHGIAKELEEKESLLVIGAGPKANEPLVFRAGSTPMRGFLEGRTQGDKYALVLHLSNMELKAPESAGK